MAIVAAGATVTDREGAEATEDDRLTGTVLDVVRLAALDQSQPAFDAVPRTQIILEVAMVVETVVTGGAVAEIVTEVTEEDIMNAEAGAMAEDIMTDSRVEATEAIVMAVTAAEEAGIANATTKRTECALAHT